jgi:hypothetical protein
VTETVRDNVCSLRVAVTVTVPLLDDPLVLAVVLMVNPVAPLPPAVLDNVSQEALLLAVQLPSVLTVIVFASLEPCADHEEVFRLRVGPGRGVHCA